MIPFPRGKYHVILADPPWNERGGGKIVRGAQRHYPLMKTKEVCALPVGEIADKDCHLYLWVTNNFLPDGLLVIEAWGFSYITMITWVKDKIGLGQYFRGQTEHCLFARKGKLPFLIKDGRRAQGVTVFGARRRRHSQKPERMRRMIDHVSGSSERRKIELFAREKVSGWDAWGYEAHKE